MFGHFVILCLNDNRNLNVPRSYLLDSNLYLYAKVSYLISLLETWQQFFFFGMCFVSVSQGRIACANVLSDLYAMGITECDNMLMLLSVSQKMSDKVRMFVSKSRGIGCVNVPVNHLKANLYVNV